jgi:hypothetical protein
MAEAILGNLLTNRQARLAELVAGAEALIVEAAALRNADGEIARAFKDGQFTPWAEAVGATFETLRETILIHLPELRSAGELARHDAPLAVREHGELLREIRRLTTKIDGLRHDRPTGPSLVNQTQTVGMRPSNVASEILELLLPPDGNQIMAEATRDVLSRLSLGEAGVPFEILHGADGGQPPVWDAPQIVRLLEAEAVPA